MQSDQKMWGNKPFWGLGYEFDPQWTLTLEQKEMQRQLIELAQTSLRANAIESDRDLIFPRKNFEASQNSGCLGYLYPKNGAD